MSIARNAGILMHVTSLPSPFGVGDVGPAARTFLRFLHKSHQRYWQLLPIHPVIATAGYSPYSPVSVMAGNTLLISPEMLAEEGLLDAGQLPAYYLPVQAQADFSTAVTIKNALLREAYQHFTTGSFPQLKKEYDVYLQKQQYWLEAYTCFMLLQQQHKGLPWHQWPSADRTPVPQLFSRVLTAHRQEADRLRWEQFIFDYQWRQLRKDARKLGVHLIGDIPFYPGYHSADVWAAQSLFKVDAQGKLKGVAGVPPDYFNAEGQHWGMPVYDWDAMKAQQYKWWISRIRRCLEWYDSMRLDHFRAFSAYWEIPGKDTSAVNGRWQPGPGAALFEAWQQHLGTLPFIAEDLGEIDAEVYQLRDRYQLPGMHVLQFAFGKDMATSTHIPHHHRANAVVYTGTHDNNTTRGWFLQDTAKTDRMRLTQYIGKRVFEKSVHLVLGRMAYASVAQTVILPIQDVLGLAEDARMNIPAKATGNWTWRLLPEQLTEAVISRLKYWVLLYDRKQR
ncbi:4-alpha-glucanotransferase [Chitinophaga pendula]|uniref:4-alpha-glucanotransferase n=1 Tax=Chitinophaga TaxID=79328 RepID=UPI000BAF2468|nr:MULTISPECIES: 4-alpha-glucanotransferase [Chitinophaga]ASZ14183.1 4-alpha-glucanotransferase [Chitinophaga sp. MD30]UCJ08181.1 4-alpha-glucanotransferase [Chitinophaga pendula]